MLYAIKNEERILASPKNKAECLLCHKPMIAKCGDINIWHWAHESMIDCDNFSEGETKWHLDWKNKFNKDDVEKNIIKNNVCHRADIFIKNTVVELQNSTISTEDIYKREIFYGNMIWIFNAEKFINNFQLRQKDSYFSFRWKHPRKSIWYCKKPIYFDMGDGIIFHVKKIHHNIPCGGWGIPIHINFFVRKLREEIENAKPVSNK